MRQASEADLERLAAALARLLAEWWRRQQENEEVAPPVGGRPNGVDGGGTPKTTTPWVRGQFSIHEEAGGGWFFKPSRYSSKRGHDAAVRTAVDRVRAALNPETFAVFKQEMMLSPRCSCCGKALTDPAGLVRWFGPERAETSSLLMPRMYRTGLGVAR